MGLSVSKPEKVNKFMESFKVVDSSTGEELNKLPGIDLGGWIIIRAKHG